MHSDSNLKEPARSRALIENVLWLVLVMLLAVDVGLLAQRRRLEQRLQDLEIASESSAVKVNFADEEQNLLVVTRQVPAGFPRSRAASQSEESVEFFLLASVNDCTNSVEDEIEALNRIAIKHPSKVRYIQGFFVDENKPDMANRFIQNLNPAPKFPISIRNVLSRLPGATTPLVLVVRTGDGRILDAHKPIPQYVGKRKAFYARWSTVLGMD